MKGFNKKYFLFLYVSTYLLNAPYTTAQTNPSPAELEALARTIANVQEQIETTRLQRGSVELDLENNEKAIQDASQAIVLLQSQISEEQLRLQGLEQQGAELESSRQSQEVLIGQYLRAAYQNGRQEYLKLLLNQENIASSARMLRYYQYFNNARSEKIQEFKSLLANIETISSEIQEATAELLIRRDSLLAEQNTLEQRQTERLALLQELDNTLAARGTELSRLEVQYEEMTLLIEELSRAIVDLPLGSQGQDFSSLKGALPWPLEGPMLNAYGVSYELGDLNWEGITIAGRAGAEIKAIHHGRVIYSDWFSNSGLLLIIDHGDGYMSLYAHNQLLYKEVGEWVTSGEIIAAVGNTGGRDENGVYFEIRYNGKAQDPINWLVRR
tara:strand:- start:58258 stop:59412 length:1155 start_codon:yes stop_codon:yes gene_type:complete